MQEVVDIVSAHLHDPDEATSKVVKAAFDKGSQVSLFPFCFMRLGESYRAILRYKGGLCSPQTMPGVFLLRTGQSYGNARRI